MREACELDLWLGSEPSMVPMTLAGGTGRRAGCIDRATGRMTSRSTALAMTGFDWRPSGKNAACFWSRVSAHGCPAAAHHSVKHATGRDKDRLFLATHRDALEQLLKRDPD
jgi:hypothetical protein